MLHECDSGLELRSAFRENETWTSACVITIKAVQYVHLNLNHFFFKSQCHQLSSATSLRWGRWCHQPPWPGCRPACEPGLIGPPALWSGLGAPCWCHPSESSSSPTEREQTGTLRTGTTWTPSAWWEDEQRYDYISQWNVNVQQLQTCESKAFFVNWQKSHLGLLLWPLP